MTLPRILLSRDVYQCGCRWTRDESGKELLLECEEHAKECEYKPVEPKEEKKP